VCRQIFELDVGGMIAKACKNKKRCEAIGVDDIWDPLMDEEEDEW